MTSLIAQVGGFNVLESLQEAFTTLVNYLPVLIGALLILVIGFIIAKLLQKGLTKLLRRFEFDQRMTSGHNGEYVQRFSPQGSPARLVGMVVFWVLMVFVIAATIAALQIPALTAFMNQVLGYLPRVIAALLILVVAAVIAKAVGGLAQRTMGDTPTGRVVRTAAPALVMAIAVFMILNQLNIAPVIVTITYAALIGALALGAALAFGLGGREAAANMINSGYQRAQQQQDQVRRDVQRARERGEQDAQRAREYAETQAMSAEQPRAEQPRQGGSYRSTP